MSQLIFCTGFKGGVGKSFMSMAVVDYLNSKEMSPVVVETDTTNPDIFKVFEGKIPTFACDLDVDDGWSSLFTICDGNAKSPVVVNAAARADKGFSKNIESLACAMEALQRQPVSMFMMNAERDSMDLLCDFFDATQGINLHKIVVIKNGYFGEDDAFGLFNTSKIKKRVEEKGGASMYLPPLPSIVRQKIKIERMTFEDAGKSLSFGDRIFLDAWQKKVRISLEKIL